MLLPCGRCYATRVILPQFEFWDVIQNLIPYVRQMVLAYISIEGWIVHPDVNSCLYGSDDVLVLSPHNAAILNGGIMTCNVMVVIYWGGGLLMFLKPLTRSSL